jgi:hypothetical protein
VFDSLGDIWTVAQVLKLPPLRKDHLRGADAKPLKIGQLFIYLATKIFVLEYQKVLFGQ